MQGSTFAEIQEEVVSKTKSTIAAHARVFQNKDDNIINRLSDDAEKESERLAFKGHHRVKCPSCGCNFPTLH